MHDGGVTVLFTTPAPTLAALRAAQRLTWGRSEPVRLVVTLPVPYPLPLENQPVPLGFSEREIIRLAALSPVRTKIEMYLCRDHRDVLRDHLQPGSIVVLGGERPRWWRTGERKLARWLRANGHSVFLAAPEEEDGQRALCTSVMQVRMPNSSH